MSFADWAFMKLAGNASCGCSAMFLTFGPWASNLK